MINGGSQVNVTLAGLSGVGAHECSRKVKLVPDASLDEAVLKGPYDIVILPGGLGGSKAFAEVRIKTVQHSAG